MITTLTITGGFSGFVRNAAMGDLNRGICVRDSSHLTNLSMCVVAFIQGHTNVAVDDLYFIIFFMHQCKSSVYCGSGTSFSAWHPVSSL